MLGKMGKFLRILGFDTKIADPDLSDTQILEEALSDERILLTKDKEFHGRMLNSYYPSNEQGMSLYVNEPNLESQISFIFKSLDIDPSFITIDDPQSFIKRCSVCNGNVKSIDKESIKDSISNGTYEHHDLFWQCSSCHSIFWIGAHWKKIFETMAKIKHP